MPTRLTRPQRRRIYAPLLILSFAVVAAWLFLQSGYTYRNSGGVGQSSRRFGMFVPYLEIRELDVSFGGAFGRGMTRGPGYQATWDWNPVGIIVNGAALLAFGLLCRHGWRKAMSERLVGRCDQCGYDLTGLASDTCPECGEAVFAAPRLAPAGGAGHPDRV